MIQEGGPNAPHASGGIATGSQRGSFMQPPTVPFYVSQISTGRASLAAIFSLCADMQEDLHDLIPSPHACSMAAAKAATPSTSGLHTARDLSSPS